MAESTGFIRSGYLQVVPPVAFGCVSRVATHREDVSSEGMQRRLEALYAGS